jgi:uncharacterized protein DUF6894
MQKYFFHIAGAKPHRDDSGTPLRDDDAAWREAKRLARDIEDNLQPGESWQLEVTGESGPVYTLTFVSRRHREHR